MAFSQQNKHPIGLYQRGSALIKTLFFVAAASAAMTSLISEMHKVKIKDANDKAQTLLKAASEYYYLNCTDSSLVDGELTQQKMKESEIIRDDLNNQVGEPFTVTLNNIGLNPVYFQVEAVMESDEVASKVLRYSENSKLDTSDPNNKTVLWIGFPSGKTSAQHSNIVMMHLHGGSGC